MEPVPGRIVSRSRQRSTRNGEIRSVTVARPHRSGGSLPAACDPGDASGRQPGRRVSPQGGRVRPRRQRLAAKRPVQLHHGRPPLPGYDMGLSGGRRADSPRHRGLGADAVPRRARPADVRARLPDDPSGPGEARDSGRGPVAGRARFRVTIPGSPGAAVLRVARVGTLPPAPARGGAPDAALAPAADLPALGQRARPVRSRLGRDRLFRRRFVVGATETRSTVDRCLGRRGARRVDQPVRLARAGLPPDPGHTPAGGQRLR